MNKFSGDNFDLKIMWRLLFVYQSSIIIIIMDRMVINENSFIDDCMYIYVDYLLLPCDTQLRMFTNNKPVYQYNTQHTTTTK